MIYLWCNKTKKIMKTLTTLAFNLGYESAQYAAKTTQSPFIIGTRGHKDFVFGLHTGRKVFK